MTLKAFFDLDWEISWQAINVADAASGAGGDITITSGGKLLLAGEVTERTVDRARIASTFNTKIAPAGMEDYLFFTKTPNPDAEAQRQAHQYFAQGHEVNFVVISNWIIMLLSTMGKRGRSIFNDSLLALLDRPDVPTLLKVAWNEQISKMLAT